MPYGVKTNESEMTNENSMDFYCHHADPDDTEEHICLIANTAGSQ